MERVETLSKMLQHKIESKATYDDILVTVKMIESELLHLKTIEPINKFAEKPTTTIDIFRNGSDDDLPSTHEKIVEVLQVDEKEVEAELEEIKHNLSQMAFMAAKNKPALQVEEHEVEKENIKNLFDEEIVNKEETLVAVKKTEPISSKEINETIQTVKVVSLNEKLQNSHHEIKDKLKDAPINDLKKAIGVNERFLYVNELFRSDDTVYDNSIKTINAFTNFADAELWIRRELTLRLGWDDNYNTVKQFYNLVRRRFS